MVAENGIKERLSMQEYGELLTDCSFSGVNAGMVPLILGLVCFPLGFKKLNKFVTLGAEIQVASCVFGAVALAAYNVKRVARNCEEKVKAKYET